jgi:hypothetical protein
MAERPNWGDVDRKPGCRLGLDLGHERAVEFDCGEPRGAVRIARDAYLEDSARLQEPAVDHLDGGMEGAHRGGEIALDDKHALDARVVGQPAEMVIERGAARKAARREVRYRLEACGGKADRGVDLVGERARRNSADVDRSLVRDAGAEGAGSRTGSTISPPSAKSRSPSVGRHGIVDRGPG